jgi:hypothetical protein
VVPYHLQVPGFYSTVKGRAAPESVKRRKAGRNSMHVCHQHLPILPNSSVKPWNPRAKGTNTVTQLLGQACKDKILTNCKIGRHTNET